MAGAAFVAGASKMGAAGISGGSSMGSSLIGGAFKFASDEANRVLERNKFSRTNDLLKYSRLAYIGAGLDPNLAALGVSIPYQQNHLGGKVFATLPRGTNLSSVNFASPALSAIMR